MGSVRSLSRETKLSKPQFVKLRKSCLCGMNAVCNVYCFSGGQTLNQSLPISCRHLFIPRQPLFVVLQIVALVKATIGNIRRKCHVLTSCSTCLDQVLLWKQYHITPTVAMETVYHLSMYICEHTTHTHTHTHTQVLMKASTTTTSGQLPHPKHSERCWRKGRATYNPHIQ